MMGYPKKGEIYLVNFDPTIGHEVDKKRLINKIGNIEDKEIINKINKVISEHFGL